MDISNLQSNYYQNYAQLKPFGQNIVSKQQTGINKIPTDDTFVKQSQNVNPQQKVDFKNLFQGEQLLPTDVAAAKNNELLAKLDAISAEEDTIDLYNESSDNFAFAGMAQKLDGIDRELTPNIGGSFV